MQRNWPTPVLTGALWWLLKEGQTVGSRMGNRDQARTQEEEEEDVCGFRVDFEGKVNSTDVSDVGEDVEKRGVEGDSQVLA